MIQSLIPPLLQYLPCVSSIFTRAVVNMAPPCRLAKLSPSEPEKPIPASFAADFRPRPCYGSHSGERKKNAREPKCSSPLINDAFGAHLPLTETNRLLFEAEKERRAASVPICYGFVQCRSVLGEEIVCTMCLPCDGSCLLLPNTRGFTQCFYCWKFTA